jgi:lipopolysaccharide export system protein LptA
VIFCGPRTHAIAFLVAALAGAAAHAAAKPSASPLLPGANSKEPISIEADKLNYYDKEQKAVYTGNVVAVQGDSRLTCAVMTIFLAKAEAPAAGAPGPAGAPMAANGAPAGGGGSQVKHMDAKGPVTVVSKTQVATGDRGAYDKQENKVWLFGNVTLSDDGGNVTKGDKLTYDLTTGEAIVEVDPPSGDKRPRVTGVFIQGSGGAADDGNKQPAPKKDVPANSRDKPKTATKQAPSGAAPLKSSGT